MKKLFWLFVVILSLLFANQSVFAAYPTTTEHHKVYPYTSVMASPYSCDNTGSIDIAAAIEELKANQSNVGTIYFPHGTYKLATNLTIPVGMRIEWEVNAKISIATGVTLTILGSLQDTNSQHFILTGTGVVDYTSAQIDSIKAAIYGTDQTALTLADAAAVAANKRLVITPGDWPISTDLTLSSAVKVMPGADLQVATGKTLTINGAFEAGLNQVFSCTGTGKVVFGTGVVKEVFPQWWGNVGGGVGDDSIPVQAAFNTGLPVHFIGGTYLINVTAPYAMLITGDGSTKSIILPYSTTTATITYTHVDSWEFHTQFNNLGFSGPGAQGTRTGVGFTCGQTNPANYGSDNEYIGRVTFHNCHFYNLEKGVQFPFGNIGCQFYDCGWSYNYYGIYNLNDKYGDAMQSGIKTLHGGELHNNICAIYCHDSSGINGGWSFKNTIFEQNFINMYCYSNGNINPIDFEGIWVEASGHLATGVTATVDIDAWTGTTRTTQSVAPYAWIFNGTPEVNFIGGGIFGDCHLMGQGRVTVSGKARVETQAGYGGYYCLVDNPNDAQIVFEDIVGITPGMPIPGVIYKQFNQIYGSSDVTAGANMTNGRTGILPHRSHIVTLGPAITKINCLTFEAAEAFDSLLTETVESDSILYATCNEYTGTVTAAQWPVLNNTDTGTTLSAGYWVYTIDAKVTSGRINIIITDGTAATPRLADFIISTTVCSTWTTFGGIGYVASGTPRARLFAQNTGGAACTFRLSALQMVRFGSLQEAQDYLASKSYAE